MDRQLLFARHLARLVWLLAHDRTAVDEQKGALRAMVTLVREGPVRLANEGDALTAGGEPVPAALAGVGEMLDALAARGAPALVVARDVTPGELLNVARVLARVDGAVHVDGGARFEEGRRTVQGGDDAAGGTGRGAPPRHQVATAAAPDQHPDAALRIDSPLVSPAIVPAPVAAVSPNVTVRTVTPPAPAALPAAAPPPAAPAPPATPPADADDELPLLARESPLLDAAELPALAVVSRLTPPATAPVGAPAPVDEPITPAAAAALASVDAARSDVALQRALESATEIAEQAAREGDSHTVVAVWRALQRRELGARGLEARAAYLAAASRLGRPAVLRSVASAVARHPEVARDAMIVIERAGSDGAAAVVELASASSPAEERAAYVEALSRLAAGPPTLVRMLRDPRWHVARDAAVLLGELRTTIAEGPLADLLAHGDDRVRRAAAIALGRLGSPHAVRALRSALGDAAPEVRAQAAASLAEREGASSAVTLATALDAEADAGVQEAILAALGRLATPDAVERLIKAAEPERRLFRKKSLPLRVAAVKALAEARTPAAVSALQSLANDKEALVREAAVDAARSRPERTRNRARPAGT